MSRSSPPLGRTPLPATTHSAIEQPPTPLEVSPTSPEPTRQPVELTLGEKLASCHAIPNHSVQKITPTTRLFINLPKDVYPDKEANLQFSTVSGDATAGWISNAGPFGEAFEATPRCWSYYFEFDGAGEIELRVKSAIQGMPDYFVRFLVSSG